jgi:Domain of unknown function (DUF3859)
VYGVDYKLRERTTTIRARNGTSFGVICKAIGSPEGAMVSGITVSMHPPMNNPKIHETRTSITSPWRAPIGTPFYLGYRLEHEYEMVPGTWKFQIYHGGNLLAEKTFEVVLGG